MREIAAFAFYEMARIGLRSMGCISIPTSVTFLDSTRISDSNHYSDYFSSPLGIVLLPTSLVEIPDFFFSWTGLRYVNIPT